ncbi:MAG: thiamine pyrophosphate-dependent enzyme [Nanoarchaeota archaeon]|nr:2-oxoacid:ferredoxin oxidoreductase subunit beta [Nanoarchaeota archaeon]MBU1632500.1 2-oxoacid:ferredoxin oxidoreductase subunit beta [Nanoarchaeota archaeon]MBU1876704.1 2-oxoacid:ferredoxin oxidoreductase subunit beta [Nanoarchaeota archaeon]
MSTKNKLKTKLRIKLGTKNEDTWCPGCPNHNILESTKRVLTKLIGKGYKQEDFAMVTGIGCHAKIFDYLNISGIYGLHGRVLPTALGIKLGNPNLTVLGFAGDGDTYAEGMAHFIHAGRYNANMTLVVHDNQSFSLTTGQSTPTSQQGYKNKAKPFGEFDKPLNPIKLALASGMSFIARCNARDVAHTERILEKAIRHKGFSFVEIIQDCLIFNLEANNKDGLMYKISDNKNKKKAEQLAEEWDYNNKHGRIPLGVIYQEKKKTLEEKWPQLAALSKTLRKRKISRKRKTEIK